ncbi:MAG: C40 family peptidase [Actinobacteria bacterium]|nr:C40 family peptidase [Actinomycetota bacterium]
MSSHHTRRTARLRRLIVTAALATATVSTLALPVSGAQAAPASSPAKRSAEPDRVAAEAVQAISSFERSQITRDGSAMTEFEQGRDHIAAVIAVRLEIDPAVMQDAWRRADRDHQLAILAALTQLGVPYRHNASKPGVGFDCSGLTTYAWGQVGYELKRQSTAQIRDAAPRDAATAQAGDLVQYPGHVMIWLGVDRAIVHAPYSGRNVEVDFFSTRRKVKYGDPTG